MNTPESITIYINKLREGPTLSYGKVQLVNVKKKKKDVNCERDLLGKRL